MSISSNQCINDVRQVPHPYLDLERLADLLGMVEDGVSWDGSLEPTPIAPEGILSACLSSTIDDLMKMHTSLPRQVSYCSAVGSMSTKMSCPSSAYLDAKVDKSKLLLTASCTSLATASGRCESAQAMHSCQISTSRSRRYNTAQWEKRFQELLLFRKQHGHLFVPHDYPANPKLSQWVKRYVELLGYNSYGCLVLNFCVALYPYKFFLTSRLTS
jgi:hypothetical protein